jgi:phosphoribosylformylglycinamidine synthase subunit PurS
VKVTVLVRPKEGILDPQGEAVRSALGHLGLAVEDARVGRLVDLELPAGGGDAAETERLLDEACRQLLANPLIESYEIHVAEEA